MYRTPGKKLMFMGAEFGQGREWNYDRSLDWHLLEQPLHASLKRFVADLNHVYTSERALHEVDTNPAGFQWIDCNDSDNSVVAMPRFAKDPDDFLICAFNFTPQPRYGYVFGVPRAGTYTELLNSDGAAYGGGNVGNNGLVTTDPIPSHGYADSIRITLPPLACLMLKPPARVDRGIRWPRGRGRHVASDISRIRFHSSSDTGITDSRGTRVRTNVANLLSALIDASVTGAFSFLTGSTSTANSLPVLSAGSG